MWHYADESGETGPITLGQLLSVLAKNGKGGDTFVWRPGLADWMRAFEIPEVASRLPPPLPGRKIHVPDDKIYVAYKKPQPIANQGLDPAGYAWFVVLGLMGLASMFSVANFGTRWPASRPVAPSCRTDYSLCSSNEEMVKHYGRMFDARRACKNAVEETARFGVPDFNIYFFGTFDMSVDQALGKVTLIDDDVRIKSGLTAPTRMRVVCSYDFKTGVAAIDSIN